MEIVIYFVGFFIGGLTLLLASMLDVLGIFSVLRGMCGHRTHRHFGYHVFYFGEAMKITDVSCSCTCGWNGTVGDCEPDIDGDGGLGCPVCLETVTCDKVYPPIIFFIYEITIIGDRETGFIDDGNMIRSGHSWPLLTASITCHAPRDFRGGRLLQAVGKRVEIRILGDFDDSR